MESQAVDAEAVHVYVNGLIFRALVRSFSDASESSTTAQEPTEICDGVAEMQPFDLSEEHALIASTDEEAQEGFTEQSKAKSQSMFGRVAGRAAGAMNTGIFYMGEAINTVGTKWNEADNAATVYAKKVEDVAKDTAASVSNKSREARQSFSETTAGKYSQQLGEIIGSKAAQVSTKATSVTAQVSTKATSVAQAAKLMRTKTGEAMGKVQPQSVKQGLMTAKGKMQGLFGQKASVEESTRGGA
mmetsp:Transcript_71108/g.112399  ORF Transcript_71108/g.112399 Transcript_71108/m.112399 type:complete len:244 (-) Transcript_71108:111-842(-)